MLIGSCGLKTSLYLTKNVVGLTGQLDSWDKLLGLSSDNQIHMGLLVISGLSLFVISGLSLLKWVLPLLLSWTCRNYSVIIRLGQLSLINFNGPGNNLKQNSYTILMIELSP